MSPLVVVKGGRGLPYSRALMVQSLSAVGVPPDRAWDHALRIEFRLLSQRDDEAVAVGDLREVVRAVLAESEGPEAVRRFDDWKRLGILGRPLVILLAGAPGVGKSTLASLLASRLGITRVIATDAIRQVIRTFVAPELMPAVHVSSFEAGWTVERPPAGTDPDLAGFARQVESVTLGARAIVERAAQEQGPLVLEGVHLAPGLLGDELRERVVAVHAVVAVPDEEVHRSHFTRRGAERPAARYLDRFAQIRKLQDHLVERAAARGVPVIEQESLDDVLERTMELVFAEVSRAVGAHRP